MQKSTKFFSKKDCNYLNECVNDIFEFHKKGSLKENATLRQLDIEVQKNWNVDEIHSLRITEELVLLEIARRWQSIRESLNIHI
jgi:hypothetical protein